MKIHLNSRQDARQIGLTAGLDVTTHPSSCTDTQAFTRIQSTPLGVAPGQNDSEPAGVRHSVLASIQGTAAGLTHRLASPR